MLCEYHDRGEFMCQSNVLLVLRSFQHSILASKSIYCISPYVSLLQGFHRYSTDSSWHVPHFEKMLYDQAQLAVAYITASQVCLCVCSSPSILPIQ